MSVPARFPFGISTSRVDKTLGSYLAPDPTKVFGFFCDFTGLDYVAAQWTVTETQAGATQALVAANAAGEYGLVAMVNTAGAADINSIQLTTAPIFYAGSSKKFWLKGKISRDNADAKIGFGFQAVNATPFTLADGVFAYINSASTDATFAIAEGSAVTTATGSAAYAASALNTFVSLGMYYDGSVVHCYVDDVHVADISTLTNLPDNAALTPTLSTMNSTANARTMHADYLFLAIER